MIYCVEDDASIREIEVYTLESMGFHARGFGDPKHFWQALQEEIPELVLLDLMLPNQDGMSILRTLKQDARYKTIPVIIASAKSSEYDKIIGLDDGADDYLVKPFGMMEMISRIKAVLRRYVITSEKIIKSQGIIMHVSNHTVMVDGQKVSLTKKEFDLLSLFLKKPQFVYTREVLLQQVWESSFMGESRTVDMHITTLRAKIEPYGKRIQTVRGVGYRYVEDER